MAYPGSFGEISFDFLTFVVCEFEGLNRVLALFYRRVILPRRYQRLVAFLNPNALTSFQISESR